MRCCCRLNHACALSPPRPPYTVAAKHGQPRLQAAVSRQSSNPTSLEGSSHGERRKANRQAKCWGGAMQGSVLSYSTAAWYSSSGGAADRTVTGWCQASGDADNAAQPAVTSCPSVRAWLPLRCRAACATQHDSPARRPPASLAQRPQRPGCQAELCLVPCP